MAQAFISRRGGKSKSSAAAMERILRDINYTGRMLSMMKIMDGTLYALLILETSGTLTVNGSYTGDVWLCGGGGGGGTSYMPTGGYCLAGGGGGGGYTANKTDISIVSGAVTIGAGGQARRAGGQTSAFGLSADGGGSATIPSTSISVDYCNGGDGGSGGGMGGWGNNYSPGKGQGTSTRPFLSEDMLPACAGGAGGASDSTTTPGSEFFQCTNGGSDGSDGSAVKGATGGEYGGGNGGTYANNHHGCDGQYYGAGGGGAGYTSVSGSNGNPGAVGHGHDGAVMIRIQI